MKGTANGSLLGEVWMEIDSVKLRKLALIQEASHRDIAEAAGWNSHSYVSRLMRGDAKSVSPEAAVRIALFFGVPVDYLFLPKASKKVVRPVKRSVA
jgi:transcriptional regulator with XRE-family HTH domain